MAQINFKGKSLVQNHHFTVPHHKLVVNTKKSLSKKPGLDDNLIIHGDNLLALKALLPTHAGKVKCIYIDPPYNIGNEGWTYNDNANSPMIQEWLGKAVNRDDLTRHDKWLCMMLPRVKLLRDFLRADGVIFVSIDDNEQHRMRLLMDEVFGEENFIAVMVWEGALKNDSRFVSVSHDYILCYACNQRELRMNDEEWRTRKEGIETIYDKVEQLKEKYGKDLETICEELQGWYRLCGKKHPAWQHRHYNEVDDNGIYFPGDISWPGGGGPRYQVLHPKTHKPVTIPARGWVYAKKERMQKAIDEGRVCFGSNERKVPTLKRYLHEIEGQVLPSVFYQDRRAAMQRLRAIFGGDVFENPKDERILQKIIEAVTNKESIVLDSFAGSGTTAHAVLALNKEDGGNRKFILVQLPEEIKKEGPAYKLGFRQVVDITAERVRRVIKGVKSAKDNVLRGGLDGSFTYLELGDSVDAARLLKGKKLPSWRELARYVFFAVTGQKADEKSFNERKCYIGSSDEYDIYLFYKPDRKWLEGAALTLDNARTLPKPRKGRKRLVFAPAKYLDQEQLDELGIAFAQLPFEVYRRAA